MDKVDGGAYCQAEISERRRGLKGPSERHDQRYGFTSN